MFHLILRVRYCEGRTGRSRREARYCEDINHRSLHSQKVLDLTTPNREDNPIPEGEAAVSEGMAVQPLRVQGSRFMV